MSDTLVAAANLSSRKAYVQALSQQGWELLEWDENPLTEQHMSRPVRVKVKTDKGKVKDFLILRMGNGANLCIIKKVNGVPHVLVQQEAKASGITVTSVVGGYADPEDGNDVFATMLREADEEFGFSRPDGSRLVKEEMSHIPCPNNMTGGITAGIIEVPESYQPVQGTFVPLAQAAAQVDISASRIAVFVACAYFGIVPELNFSKVV